MSKNAAEKYLGMTQTMKCGMKATIIAYRRHDDIDVKFEDGSIREHVSTCQFNKNYIAPSTPYRKTKYIGKTKVMNNGMKATIIEYKNSKDITIQFENGTIREHIALCSFNNSQVAIEQRTTKKSIDYIGQTHINFGMKATIIAYRGWRDIDVKFENGTIRKYTNISQFNKGTIKPPYLGRINMMKCGLKASIINYKGCNDLNVKFEDGTICKHTTTREFNNGSIPHPTGVLFNKYKMNGVAFRFHNTTYFYVTCVDDRKEIVEIMCIDDIKQKLQIH